MAASADLRALLGVLTRTYVWRAFSALLTAVFCWDHPNNEEALMPHPVYGKPTHDLEVVTARIILPSPANGHVTQARVVGEASTRRTTLWNESASWTPEEAAAGLQPTDWVAHILLCALQDRPRDQGGLDNSLIGQGWEDIALPF